MAKFTNLILDILLSLCFAFICFMFSNFAFSQEQTLPCGIFMENLANNFFKDDFNIITNQINKDSSFILFQKNKNYDSLLVAFLIIDNRINLPGPSYFSEALGNNWRNARYKPIAKCQNKEQEYNIYQASSLIKGAYI